MANVFESTLVGIWGIGFLVLSLCGEREFSLYGSRRYYPELFIS